MIQLEPRYYVMLPDRFLPDRPGPLCALHVLETGHGALFADRWPGPRALLADAAGNYALCGSPDALGVQELRNRIQGFVEAAAPFRPRLEEAFPDLRVWERVILSLDRSPPRSADEEGRVRRLEPEDGHHLRGLPPEIAWISKTWGGATGLAVSRRAFGAFVDGRLASVAVPFFVGRRHEDIGVVTRAEQRGRSLSPACAAAVAEDVRARGRRPSWSTSPDNHASLRVAAKLGFEIVRRDVLYVVGEPVPEPARPD